MIEIKASPRFMRLSKKALTLEALQKLVDELTLRPEKGVVMTGTGGIRKVRWQTGKSNKGKSAGIRVLYYYDGFRKVFLLDLFKKADKENIDAGEKEQLKRAVLDMI